MHKVAFAIVALFLPLTGYGQEQNVERVFYFAHTESQQNRQEIATSVNSIATPPYLYVDNEKKSLAIRGSADQIALADWLFHELDQLHVTTPQPSREFKSNLKDGDGAIVRVFYIANAATVQDFQEIATAVRTTVEIRRIFVYNGNRALVIRTTPEKATATEWLVTQLDVPGPAPHRNSSTLKSSLVDKDGTTMFGVFYLPSTATVQDFQEVATLIRTIGDIRRVFTYNSARALAIRGTPDQLSLAGWLVNEFNQTATVRSASPSEFHMSGDGENIVRVYYIKNVTNAKELQQIATQVRTSAQIRHLFTYNAPKAIAMRGTASQMSAADIELAQLK